MEGLNISKDFKAVADSIDSLDESLRDRLDELNSNLRRMENVLEKGFRVICIYLDQDHQEKIVKSIDNLREAIDKEKKPQKRQKTQKTQN